MLLRALIKSDKTVFLRIILYRNGLIICIVVHETLCQKYILKRNQLCQCQKQPYSGILENESSGRSGN